MDMWNKRLERENINDFYNETIDMVYPSVYSICKETTRTEQAIVKSYVDVFQQRQNISGEEVMFVFGDILLKNANDIVEKYELPENLTFGERSLDEYTRNSMFEKIVSKIDSKGFKVAEFISSDAKKIKNGKSKKDSFSIVVTPLLIFHMVVLALLIWGISYVAITLPYRHNELVSDKISDSVPLQEKYVSVLDYLPMDVDYIENSEADSSAEETQPSEELEPSFASTEPTATKG